MTESELAMLKAERDALQTEVTQLRALVALRERQIHGIQQVTEALRANNPAVIARAAFAAAQATLLAPAATIYLHDPVTDQLRFAYVAGSESQTLLQEIRAIPASQGVAGKVFQTGQIDIAVDIRTSEAFDDSIDARTKFWTEGPAATLPLKRPDGTVFGVLQVLNGARNAFTDADIEVLKTLAHYVGLALDLAERGI
jgi:GAF domain-containing protein